MNPAPEDIAKVKSILDLEVQRAQAAVLVFALLNEKESGLPVACQLGYIEAQEKIEELWAKATPEVRRLYIKFLGGLTAPREDRQCRHAP